ncbi:MAG: family metallopeptidase [Bacillales bacterium]|jgi:hypothetical protein|nr:family metallopeptidase [Bacillales bacterium]
MDKKLNNLHQILNETSFKKLEFSDMNKKNVLNEVTGKRSTIIKFLQRNSFSILAVAGLFLIISMTYLISNDDSKTKIENKKFSATTSNKKSDKKKGRSDIKKPVAPDKRNPFENRLYDRFLTEPFSTADKVIRQFNEFYNTGDRPTAMNLLDSSLQLRSDNVFYVRIQNDQDHPIWLYDYIDVTAQLADQYNFEKNNHFNVKDYQNLKIYYIRSNFYLMEQEGNQPTDQMVKKIVLVGQREYNEPWKIISFEDPSKSFSRFPANENRREILQSDAYEYQYPDHNTGKYYTDVPKFYLTSEEQALYNFINHKYDLNKLKNVSPITIAKLYVQAGLDENYGLEYDLMDDRPDSIQWTKEEHLKGIHKDSGNQPPTEQSQYETRILEAHLFEGKFIEKNNDGTGYILYDSPTNEVGFQMAKNAQGIWQVCFLAKQ